MIYSLTTPTLRQTRCENPEKKAATKTPFAPTNEELERVEPEEKIVETEDETEGLF